MPRFRQKHRSLARGLVAAVAIAACGDQSDDAQQPTANDEGPTGSGHSDGGSATCGTDCRGACSGGFCVSPDKDSGIAAPPPCGVGYASLCALGGACAANQDCESGLCGRQGPNDGKCVVAKSCIGTPGADGSCGDGTEPCCESIAVPGGAYVGLDIDGVTPLRATVSPFKLDKFEITVGRLRAFYNAFHGDLRDNPPAPGAGANPHVAGSGWRSSFTERLTGSWSEINERHVAACSVGGDNADYGAAVWTEEPGPNENKPINCVDWYTLFAFCVWDGGRLPTDAEWGYVGQSGDENRVYPYGDDPPTWLGLHDAIVSDLTDPPSPAYKFTYGPLYRGPADGAAPIAPVGRKSERSRFGHADLTGNVIEMTLDVAVGRPSTCDDCANVAWPDPPRELPVQPPKWQTLDAKGDPVGDEFGEARAAQDGIRIARGSSWQGEWGGHHMKNGPNRFWLPVWRTYSAAGGRCARD